MNCALMDSFAVLNKKLRNELPEPASVEGSFFDKTGIKLSLNVYRPLEITVVTNKGDNPVSKHISLTDEGKVASDGSRCNIAVGSAARLPFASMKRFAANIDALPAHAAISLGRLRSDVGASAPLVAQSMLERAAAGSVARTQDFFAYRDGVPALMLLDFDRKAMPPEVKKRLDELGGFEGAMRALIPGYDFVARTIRHSTSSGLYHADTKENYGDSGGLHVYIVVQDGGDIDRALKVLKCRATLMGLGWIYIAARGALLTRSIVDETVRTPERLVFEGAPTIAPPLAQKVRHPVAFEGEMMNSRVVLPDLTAEERRGYEKIIADIKRAAGPEADRVIKARIEKDVIEAVERGEPEARARAAAEKAYRKDAVPDLLPPLPVLFDDPAIGRVTVGDILADPKRFAEKTCSDPLEMHDSAGRLMSNKAICRIAEKTSDPFIWSNLHGGFRYNLRHDEMSLAQLIEIAPTGEVMERFKSALLMGGTDSPVSATVEGRLIDSLVKRHHVGKREVKNELNEARNKRGGPDWTDANAYDQAGVFVVDPQDHTTTAGLFLDHHYTDKQGERTMLFSKGAYYKFNGRLYVPEEEKVSQVDSELWQFMRHNCIARVRTH